MAIKGINVQKIDIYFFKNKYLAKRYKPEKTPIKTPPNTPKGLVLKK